MEKLERVLIKLVSEQLSVDASKVTLDSKFEDLGADSLDVVEIALAVEDMYDIEIPDDNAENITTIRSVLDILAPLIKE